MGNEQEEQHGPRVYVVRTEEVVQGIRSVADELRRLHGDVSVLLRHLSAEGGR